MCKKTTRHFIGLKMVICLALFFRIVESAGAQPSAEKQRPFEGVPGILVSCQSDKNVKWTSEACAYLITEVQRRATASKMAVSVQPSSPDMGQEEVWPDGWF